MTPAEHRQLCVNWATKELPEDQINGLVEQYFDHGYYGGYRSIYEFIKDHRKDLYGEYIAWLTTQKLTGDAK